MQNQKAVRRTAHDPLGSCWPSGGAAAQLSLFAGCFLSKSPVTNVAEEEGCWAPGRPSLIKERAISGMRQQNPFTTTSIVSWPPLPAHVGNRDAWSHSSRLRTMRQPALGFMLKRRMKRAWVPDDDIKLPSGL